MSKVSAQNGNWNKAKLRWVFAFEFFEVVQRSASVTGQIQSYIQKGLGKT